MLSNHDVNVLRIKSIPELKYLFSKMQGGWIFRGQADAAWPLKTHLERRVPDIDLRRDYERNFDREFQHRSHNYINRSHEDDCLRKLERLSMMQHYNIPTRLLDCTRSPFIAAYFALADSYNIYDHDNDVAIWCFNKPPLKIFRDIECEKCKYRGESKHHAQRFFSERIYLNKEDKEANGVLLLSPDKLNNRIMSQQGLFLVPLSIESSFEDNMIMALSKVRDQCSTDTIIKLLIPRTLRGDLLLELKSLNVTASSLFPDITGFSESLRIQPCIDKDIRNKINASNQHRSDVESIKGFASSNLWCEVTLELKTDSLMKLLDVFNQHDIEVELIHVIHTGEYVRMWALRGEIVAPFKNNGEKKDFISVFKQALSLVVCSDAYMKNNCFDRQCKTCAQYVPEITVDIVI